MMRNKKESRNHKGKNENDLVIMIAFSNTFVIISDIKVIYEEDS